jgi:hypothetical protein
MGLRIGKRLLRIRHGVLSIGRGKLIPLR